nr:13243_t:CDS:2 [Entrophospora candida]
MPSTRMSINNDSDKENTMDMEDVVMNNTNNSKEHSQNSRLKKYENIIGSNIYDPDQDKNEKRWLRKEYRSLIEETEEYLRPDSDGLEKNIAKANELYEKVKNTHEATLDSRLLVLSSDLGLQKARRMRLDNNCFDTEDYISKVVGRLKVRNADNEDYYDWKKIGKLAAQSTLRVPTTGFILGPLSIEQKERQKTVRRVLEKHEKDLKTPVELKENDIRRQENETTRNVRMIYDVLGESQPINFFNFIINPHSFGQTVENIFYLSFLVRDGKVSIDDDSGQPILRFDQETIGDGNRYGHLEGELSSQVYGINESVIPTRESNQVGNDGKCLRRRMETKIINK